MLSAISQAFVETMEHSEASTLHRERRPDVSVMCSLLSILQKSAGALLVAVQVSLFSAVAVLCRFLGWRIPARVQL